MGWWEGGNDLFNACRVSVLQDEKVLGVDDGDGRTTLWTPVLNATDCTLKNG